MLIAHARRGVVYRRLSSACPSGPKVGLHPVNFAALIRPLAGELGHEKAGRKVRLLLPAPPSAVTVHIDAPCLSRVFYNLSNTALDALHEGGTVTLSCGADGTGFGFSLYRKIGGGHGGRI